MGWSDPDYAETSKEVNNEVSGNTCDGDNSVLEEEAELGSLIIIEDKLEER